MHPIVAEDMREIAAAPLPWERLAGKTVLVTGAGGFLGGYIVRALLALNDARGGAPVTVIATGRNVDGLARGLADVAASPHLRFVALDLCSPVAIAARADYFIHSASPAQTSLYGKDPLGTLGPNVFGTQALLQAAAQSSCDGFLFVSSGAVYGQIPGQDGERISEEQAGCAPHLDTGSAYGESKRMGELLCRSWAVQHGLPTRIARLGHTYGPGLVETDERVFADFVFRVLRGQNIVVRSRGGAVRPFCYVADAVVGLFTVLFHGGSGEAYNLVNGDAHTSVLELAHTLAGLFPERGIQVEVQGGASTARQADVFVSTAKIEALGWKPQVGISDGFRRTILSYSSSFKFSSGGGSES